MKRAIGVAALGGGLLAFSAGAASAEVQADATARLGRPTSADVRVCADGQVLSRLVGSCRSSSSGTSATVRAGRDSARSGGIRATVRAPRASADVSVGTRGSRPRVGASGQAAVTGRSRAATAGAAADSSPGATAAVTAGRSGPRDGRLLTLGPLTSLAGVGVLGSSPFTLVGDPASDSLLPTVELTLGDLTGETPAGIGVLGSGPIASGNQVGIEAGDASASVPVTVCGNGVGVLGDTSASCGSTPPSGSGSVDPGPGSAGLDVSIGSAGTSGDSLLGELGAGNQVDAGIGDVSASVPVTVCGNAVGVLGDGSAGCGTDQPADSTGGSAGSSGDPTGVDVSAGADSGSTGVGVSTGSGGTSGGSADGDTLVDLGSGNQVDAGIGDVAASAPVNVCGNGIGALGDASASCGTDTSSGGTTPSGGSTGDGDQADVSVEGTSASVPVSACGNGIELLGDASAGCGADTSSAGTTAPPPDPTPGQTGTSGTTGDPGTTGTSGTLGLTPGTGGDPGDAITTFAPRRPIASGAGGLPFTGAAADLLATVAVGLLAAGAVFLRATRPAAVREGGDGR